MHVKSLGLETDHHSYLELVPPLNEKLPKPNDFQFLNIHSSINAELLLRSDTTLPLNDVKHTAQPFSNQSVCFLLVNQTQSVKNSAQFKQLV